MSTVWHTFIERWHVDVATPRALWLLLLLPIWWALRHVWRPPTITFSRVDVVRDGPPGGRWYVKLLFAMRNLACILLIVALARPRMTKPLANGEGQGIGIELVVDLSGSMLSQDFQPHNRLEVAKTSLRNFVLGRPQDRIGLMAFAKEAYTVTPMTADHGILLQDVANLSVGQLDDGTAIGDAITAAASRLAQSREKSKVMILLTDGVNNSGALDPVTGARAANTYGIKIYTIGIGKEGTAPVPVSTTDGAPRTEMQPVKIDEALLTQVATTTGGQYFRAVDGGTLSDVYHRIDQLERSSVRTTVAAHYAELFRWPLGIAVVLVLLELLVAAARGPLP